MDSSFNVIKTGQNSTDFIFEDPPVKHAALFIFPNASIFDDNPNALNWDIVFRGGHDVIDRMPTYSLLHNLLLWASVAFESQEFDLVQFGDEYKNLAPPFREILGLPSPTSIHFKYSELSAYEIKGPKIALVLSVFHTKVP